jgi:Xaa-Pro aminopeptidase
MSATITIPKSEFDRRVERIREILEERSADAFLVYGDEYRRENLRYVSNYFPIFDRGMLVVGRKRDPVLLVAPEGENLAQEMSVWKDIRVIPEVEPSYIPDKVDYASAQYTRLGDVLAECTGKKHPAGVRLCGLDAMPVTTYNAIQDGLQGATIENGDEDIYRMRLIKSKAEIEVLKKAWEICDAGYKAILAADVVGLTEIQAAAIGEKAARDAGAELVVFSIFCSGERTNTAVGRASSRIVREGDMVMSCLAVQYEGYIASDEWPFVAGNRPTAAQQEMISHVVRAEQAGLDVLKPGVVAGEVVKAVKQYFGAHDLGSYDIYPPIHGNGLAEAESPYPDRRSSYPFEPGMGINFDVNLFKVPGLGSNRIEEGFVIAEAGVIVLSELISSLRERHLCQT